MFKTKEHIICLIFSPTFFPRFAYVLFLIMPVIAVIAVIALSFHAVKAADFIGETGAFAMNA
ncbi:hypothetical protein WDV93_24645 [Pantoea ananatis]